MAVPYPLRTLRRFEKNFFRYAPDESVPNFRFLSFLFGHGMIHGYTDIQTHIYTKNMRHRRSCLQALISNNNFRITKDAGDPYDFLYSVVHGIFISSFDGTQIPSNHGLA